MRTSKIILAAAMAVLSISLYVAGDFTQKRSFTASTVSVTDGDTVEVNSRNRNITVRLLGIDAPEVYSANSPEEFGIRDSLENRECLENRGEKAGDLLERRIRGQDIRVETDPLADRRGSYGRLLAYIRLDNSTDSLNLILVEKGYARVYETDFKKLDEFREAERQAKRKQLGVWSCG